MDKNKNDNYLQQIEELSKGNPYDTKLEPFAEGFEAFE